MKRLSVLGVVGAFLIFGAVASTAFAHDGEIGNEENPITFDVINTEAELGQHPDADPWKGWATIWLKNICSQDWGDFHLRIYSIYGNAYFSETYQPELWIKTGTWQQYSVTPQWSTDHKVLDLYYYGNPIEQGEWAKFKIYTDNTSEKCSIFAIAGYPTPVPEPATIALLGLGGLILLKRKYKVS